MKKDIDWIQQMRKRLENHQEQVPDDLWNGITESLDVKKRARQRPVMTFYAWSRVAAIGLIFIIGGLCYYNLKYAENVQMPSISLVQNKKISISEEKLRGTTSRHSSKDVCSVSSRPLLALSQTYNDKVDTVCMAEPACSRDTIRTSSIDVTRNRNVSDRPNRKSDATQYKYTGSSVLASVPGDSYSKKKITIGVHASNVFASQNNTSSVSMSNTLCASSFMASTENEALLAYYKETKHHFQPLSFGLTMSYGLTNRLSLSTGAVYTLAISDFIRNVGEDEVKDCQHLNYIGIPLGLAYDMWTIGKLNVYAKVYGQMDFNVSASVETEGVKNKIKKDRIQMSTGATLGAEYMILPQLGFYVEPGVKYYFNNGSHVDNVFKEKPCNFSLQLGLRLSLNK